MIKIDWDEVEATKAKLFREGKNDAFEMVVIILYHKRSECEKIPIRWGQLEKSLFDLGDDQSIKGIFLYDIGMKQPYFKCETPERANILETVPSSGHPSVLLEFKDMSPEGRAVWVEIALSRIQHYIYNSEKTK